MTASPTAPSIPVWAWGGGLLVLSQLFRLAIMQSEPWLAFARFMAGLV
jgi:hypothetical protein